MLGSIAFQVGLAAAATTSAEMTFSDVNSSTDYFQAINWVAQQGIATGYQDGRWGPDDCVTRAQLVKMISLLGSLGGPVETQYFGQSAGTFKDVSKNDWFYVDVYNAKDAGWITGYADGTFKPNQCVNRAEAMKIAANTMFYNPTLDSSGGPIMYDDKIVNDIKIADWYGPFARLLFKDRLVGTNHTVRVGEVGGASLINFFPSQSMSRKEVAEMLHRIVYSWAYNTQF